MLKSIKKYFRDINSAIHHTSLVINCMNKNFAYFLSEYKKDMIDINCKLDKLLDVPKSKDDVSEDRTRHE